MKSQHRAENRAAHAGRRGWALAVLAIIALASIDCGHDCGEFPGPCFISTVRHSPSAPRPSKPAHAARHERFLWAKDELLRGATCDCAEPLCGETVAAHTYCRGKAAASPTCFDEMTVAVPRGYVRFFDDLRMFERVGDALATDGTMQSVLLNRVPVTVIADSQSLAFTATGADEGTSLRTGPRTLDPPTKSGDFSLEGVEYVCP